jgi:hypothetical protein
MRAAITVAAVTTGSRAGAQKAISPATAASTGARRRSRRAPLDKPRTLHPSTTAAAKTRGAERLDVSTARLQASEDGIGVFVLRAAG